MRYLINENNTLCNFKVSSILGIKVCCLKIGDRDSYIIQYFTVLTHIVVFIKGVVVERKTSFTLHVRDMKKILGTYIHNFL
jgi:hypothetical protein